MKREYRTSVFYALKSKKEETKTKEKKGKKIRRNPQRITWGKKRKKEDDRKEESHEDVKVT